MRASELLLAMQNTGAAAVGAHECYALETGEKQLSCATHWLVTLALKVGR